MQGQPAPGSAKDIALGFQPAVQIRPASGKGQILCEPRPQGRDEPLIRPDGRFRIGVARHFTRQQVADQLPKGDVALPRDGGGGIP